MSRIFILLLIVLAGLTANSQTITVFDNSNLQPIENLVLVNLQHTKTALTDNHGKAKLDAFNPNDNIFFQHPSYQELVLSYDQIKDLHFKIGA